ncbi:MAG: hypothetical protein PF444_07670 [Bacteroidales bacterium]|jgi:hypothetical protein|nr:hypothetical protein [Bacteroidales bacterium]
MSKFQNRKVYFFRQDISFVDYKYNYTETNDLVGGLTLGREFNFTGKIGICADIGVKILLYQDRTITNESLVPMFDFSDAVMLPQCRLQLFYSL